MWFKTPRLQPDWQHACTYLQQADPMLSAIIGRVGCCTLSPRRDYFAALCQAIISQQVATKVAAIFFKRFRGLFPSGRPNPKGVLGITDDQLKAIGLSTSKRRYIRSLAEHFANGGVPTRRFASMSDQEIIDSLIQIDGIGTWTAQMFLIFVLNRPDVLPVADLGVRKGIQVAYQLKELPAAPAIIELAEPWQPWRTIATWYLWRSIAGPAK